MNQSVPADIQRNEESEVSHLLNTSVAERAEREGSNLTSTSATGTELDTADISEDKYKEISYAINAFYATVQPVAISLILSSLAVVYIQSPFSNSIAGGGLSVYDISDEASNDSSSVKIGKSMINAIVIIAVCAIMTFLIVFLYWARCVKCIQGYLMFSSFLLLFSMGGTFFLALLDQFNIQLDWISFIFFLYNFSVVGIIAIFYQKGTVYGIYLYISYVSKFFIACVDTHEFIYAFIFLYVNF
jgi:hypothetical protein